MAKVGGIMKDNLKIYKIIALILTGAVVILTIVFVPINIPFWQFTTSDIVTLIISLLLIALFIERAVEVIMIVWRGKGKQQIISVISSEKKKSKETKKGVKISDKEDEATKKLESYSAETKTLALPTAFALGIIISALGVRALQPLVDPAIFKSLGSTQKALFTSIDTLITGALLGSGSEGMHRILDTFLKLIETKRKSYKEKLMQ